MKAIVYEEFGPPDVLQLQEVTKPIPKEDEVLIRNYVTTVNYGDLVARDFKHLGPSQFNMPGLFWLLARLSFGLNKPRTTILGNEFAGVIEAVGKDVTRFKPGDPVFGFRGQSMGAYVEYHCLPEDGVLAHKPANVSFEEAAAVPSGGMTALSIVRAQNIQPGQQILIIGASGGIGSHAVQIAKDAGAVVTGVCSTPRVAYVQALGADRVIDYTKEDFTQSGEPYDLVIDVLGRGTWARVKNVLKDNGRYVLISFKLKQLLQMVWTSLRGGKKVICALAPQSRDDLLALQKLMEAGKLKSIIDKRFPFAETAAAHRYAEQGGMQGHVVITVAADRED